MVVRFQACSDFFFRCAVLSSPIFLVWRRVVSQPSTSRTWCTRYCTAVRRAVVYTWHVFIHTECCCRCCCCSVPVLLLHQLLMFIVVCRIAKKVSGSSNLIPSSVFFLFKHNLFFHACLAVLSHLRPRIAYTTSSEITGMRGAKAGIVVCRFFHISFSFGVVWCHNRVPLIL